MRLPALRRAGPGKEELVQTSAIDLLQVQIRNLRAITNNTANKEPKWRHRGRQLTTGYRPTTY